MKKLGIYTLGLMFVLLFSQCGPTTEDAIDYNDKIIKEQVGVINTVVALDEAVATYDSKKIKTALDAANSKVEKAIKVLEGFEAFDGDSKFLDDCLALFKTIKELNENEYAEQLKIYTGRDAGNYSEVEQARSEELFSLIDEKYYPAEEKFTATQKEFATKWGFDLTKKY